MKKCSPALVTLLNSAVNLCMLDLITFTMKNGTVLRYNSGPYTINVGGKNYIPAALELGSFKQALGTNVDDLTVNWYYTSSDTVAGNQIPVMLRSGAFDFAIVQHSNLFLTAWSIAANPDYILPLFTGVLQMDIVGRSKAELRIKAMTDILNQKIPCLIYQPGCMNNLYDPATCGLSRAAYTTAGIITDDSDQLNIKCSLTQPSGYYNGGSLVFNTGLNTGFTATVKSYLPGVLSFMWPLPFPPAISDNFTIVPSCSRSQSICLSRFNNKSRYRGTPYIPVPNLTGGQ